MPVEIITTAEFEAALPCERSTGKPLWEYAGIIQGERCYLIPVFGKGGRDTGASLMVRSSIDQTGLSAECGENSIRAWVVKRKVLPYRDHTGKSMVDIEYLGTKVQKYVRRDPGWDQRLKTMLHKMYVLASNIQKCRVCDNLTKLIRIKHGPNAGSYAVWCMPDKKKDLTQHRREGHTFWVIPENGGQAKQHNGNTRH